jgi:hypothetical protein
MIWLTVALPRPAYEAESLAKSTFPLSDTQKQIHNDLVMQRRRAEQALKTCKTFEEMKEAQGRIHATEEALTTIHKFNTPTQTASYHGR